MNNLSKKNRSRRISAHHWAAPFLENAIVSFTPLTHGLQHQNDLLCLQDGSLWVAKRFAQSTWLGETKAMHLEFTEQFATVVAQQLNLTHSALRLGQSNYVIAVDSCVGMIKPYYPGETHPCLSKQQAFHLGEGLANIHQLGFAHPEAKPFPPIVCDVEPPRIELQSLIQQCNHHRTHRAQEWVVSHRDLHKQNLLWQDKNQLHILDWESAGLIHPFVELLGLALNCAGVEERHCQTDLFIATLKGYLKSSLCLPKADEILWQQGFHSWLLWYAYCQKQGKQQDVEAILTTIIYLQEVFPRLMGIYERFSNI